MVTNPASNPGFWSPAPEESWLKKGRAGLILVSGRNDVGEIFIYAIGGASKRNPLQQDIFDDAEVVQIDPFGRLGSWKPIPNRLMRARFAGGGVQHNGWIYIVGGTSDGSVPVSDCPIERAIILGKDTAPQNLRLTSISGGGLQAGTWYYRVSAVMNDSDPENPLGEGLPSEERVITVSEGSSVKLTWDPPKRSPSNVFYYRIYRTDAPNGVSQTEHLIQDNVKTTEFIDNGLPEGTVPFLPNGSTGKWRCENSTSFRPVYGLSVVLGHDANGNY